MAINDHGQRFQLVAVREGLELRPATSPGSLILRRTLLTLSIKSYLNE